MAKLTIPESVSVGFHSLLIVVTINDFEFKQQLDELSKLWVDVSCEFRFDRDVVVFSVDSAIHVYKSSLMQRVGEPHER